MRGSARRFQRSASSASPRSSWTAANARKSSGDQGCTCVRSTGARSSSSRAPRGVVLVEAGAGHRDGEPDLRLEREVLAVDGAAELEGAVGTPDAALAVDHERDLVVGAGDAAEGAQLAEREGEVADRVGGDGEALADDRDAAGPTCGGQGVPVGELRVVVDEPCRHDEVPRHLVGVLLRQASSARCVPPDRGRRAARPRGSADRHGADARRRGGREGGPSAGRRAGPAACLLRSPGARTRGRPCVPGAVATGTLPCAVAALGAQRPVGPVGTARPLGAALPPAPAGQIGTSALVGPSALIGPVRSPRPLGATLLPGPERPIGAPGLVGSRRTVRAVAASGVTRPAARCSRRGRSGWSPRGRSGVRSSSSATPDPSSGSGNATRPSSG